jgi:peptidoglycan/xylan/chitin deacetylase (PgdA/CDA1 family)
MTIRRFIPLFLALALPAFAAPQKIAIVKADDVRTPGGKWDRFIKISHEHGVNPSLGIILNSLEKPDAKYEEWLKKQAESGKVEFWNHGWDHRQWEEEGKKKSEFGNSGYDHQKQAIEKSQAASARVFGKPLTAFGSGFNAMDQDTAKVLNENADLKLIFCYAGAPPVKALKGKVLLPMDLRGENDGTGKPNFAKFKEEYAKKKDTVTFAALQFHPNSFAEQGFSEYAQILDFLKAEGWTFMLPGEYAATAAPKQ